MDALELVDLARLGSVSSGLRDVLQAPIPQLAMEHCRAASERANLLEAQLNRVVQERDAAEQERDEFALELEEAVERARVAREQRLEVSMEFRATLREHVVEVRRLERELAKSKRARTS